MVKVAFRIEKVAHKVKRPGKKGEEKLELRVNEKLLNLANQC